MERAGSIFNIQHFSVNDGPGIRTVVFFKGCPLDCRWCHNPESKSVKKELSFLKDKCIMCGKCIKVCVQNVHSFDGNLHIINRDRCVFCKSCVDICVTSALEIFGKEHTVEDVMMEIEKDDIFFGDDGGVTFSGGEPFMQFDFLYELLKSCKQKGYSTCIETSGSTKTENILKAAEYTDYFLFDCKETNAENHKIYTGADNKLILKNLEALSEVKSAVILRCPIIPGCNDRKEHFEGIAALAEQYENILRVELEPYHSFGERKNIALGREEHKFKETTENEKNLWLDAVRKHTDKKVVFA